MFLKIQRHHHGIITSSDNREETQGRKMNTADLHLMDT